MLETESNPRTKENTNSENNMTSRQKNEFACYILDLNFRIYQGCVLAK